MPAWLKVYKTVVMRSAYNSHKNFAFCFKECKSAIHESPEVALSICAQAIFEKF